MIRINLLPVRQTRKQEAARLELGLAVAGGFGVLLVVAGVWAFLGLRLASVRDENVALQAEIDKLAKIVEDVDGMEKLKGELERKLAVIDELRAKKAGPVRMIDEIAIATPEKLFLTKLEEEGGEVRLEGVSVSNDVISNFLRSLDASPYFESVFLVDIEAMPPDKNMSVTLKTFKLTARLVTPSKADKAKAAEGAAPPADGAAQPAAPAAPTDGVPPAPGAAPTGAPPAPEAAPPAPAAPAPVEGGAK